MESAHPQSLQDFVPAPDVPDVKSNTSGNIHVYLLLHVLAVEKEKEILLVQNKAFFSVFQLKKQSKQIFVYSEFEIGENF